MYFIACLPRYLGRESLLFLVVAPPLEVAYWAVKEQRLCPQLQQQQQTHRKHELIADFKP